MLRRFCPPEVSELTSVCSRDVNLKELTSLQNECVCSACVCVYVPSQPAYLYLPLFREEDWFHSFSVRLRFPCLRLTCRSKLWNLPSAASEQFVLKDRWGNFDFGTNIWKNIWYIVVDERLGNQNQESLSSPAHVSGVLSTEIRWSDTAVFVL